MDVFITLGYTKHWFLSRLTFHNFFTNLNQKRGGENLLLIKGNPIIKKNIS